MNKNKLRIIFAGTPDFAAAALQALLQAEYNVVAVYTQPDRPAGRGQKITESAVKQVALKHQLPVFQPVTLRDEHEQTQLMDLDADLMIVVAYGLILPPAVLKIPRLGCFNIHASLLPRWRGAAPIQRAIISGDAKTGVTIMQMNEGLDTGAMLYKVETPIDHHDTSQILHDRLAKLGADALLITLERLLQQNLHPEIQDESHTTYANKISKEEAELNWHLTAVELDRKIRGFNPWPVAQTRLGSQIIRIWQAEVIDQAAHDSAGKVVRVSADGIDVATGDKILRLIKLQLPGGRVLSSADILNSKREEFAIGKQFG